MSRRRTSGGRRVREVEPHRTALVLALGVLCLAGVGGCGNAVDTDVVGVTGISLDATGAPAIVVRACGADLDTVALYGSREGLREDQANPLLATWTRRGDTPGDVEIAVAGDPPASWYRSGGESREPTFKPRRLYIADAYDALDRVEATQVSFRGRDVATLTGDEVLVSDAETLTREQFEARACSERP